MYEVEIKSRSDNKELVIKNLKSLGCDFGSVLNQVDYIFTPKSDIFPPPLGVPVLRIRVENEEYLFTVKVNQSSRQDCIEYELEISDSEKWKK